MSGIIGKAVARLAARWHGLQVRLYAARIEKLLEAGEAYNSPRLSRLSSRCAGHGVKAVVSAKRGGLYKRGRFVRLACACGPAGARLDAIEQ